MSLPLPSSEKKAPVSISVPSFRRSVTAGIQASCPSVPRKQLFVHLEVDEALVESELSRLLLDLGLKVLEVADAHSPASGSDEEEDSSSECEEL